MSLYPEDNAGRREALVYNQTAAAAGHSEPVSAGAGPGSRRPDGYHLAIFLCPCPGLWRFVGFMKLHGFYPSDVPAVGPSLV